MKAKIINLVGKAAGDIELKDAIFGLPVRKDLLQRMVEWQRAKKRTGTHKTKGYGEIKCTTTKLFRQKRYRPRSRRLTRHATTPRRWSSIRSPWYAATPTTYLKKYANWR